MLPDSEVPWWAVSLLEYDKTSDEWQAWRRRQQAVPLIDKNGEYDYNAAWERVVDDAVRLAGNGTALECAQSERETCAKAALTSPRAFCQFVNLMDDNLNVFHLKDFHVRTLRYMRQKSLACVLLPYMHGKSALATVVLPLLDWAEEPESTQIRVYQSYQFTTGMTRKIMGIVETNDDLHRLFPWIRRPEKGDPCEKIWSTKGFSIGGKKAIEFSWRPMTVGGGTVGVRADRVVCDDWVTEKNAGSRAVQDRMVDYLNSSAKTMRAKRDWKSEHGTKWGTLTLIGTIFDKQDVNARTFGDWREKKWKGDKEYAVMREKVYPIRHDRETVLWPERFSLEDVKQMERQMGSRAFRLRCMNTPLSNDQVVFKEKDLEAAVSLNWKFGEAPYVSERDSVGLTDPIIETSGRYNFRGVKVLIGYDPGKGVKTKYSANPAAVVLGFRPDQTVHFIEWDRWSVPQPVQIRNLVEWARKYECPVVIEDNALQKSYSEWIAEIAPDVRVISHFSGSVVHNKEDGVESWQPLFENGKVVIHGRDCPEDKLRALLEEFTDWPQGRFKDLVMASWIARYQFKLTYKHQIVQQSGYQVPSYVSGRRSMYQTIDLRKYQR